eukprot:CAMPEP_0117815300 /NCGR_PEP_ID=MMETSP0948-20121206/24708_1 /TAXON_ID=44440 /ORGANISM="Chattonella subsalsa, Strain CCMP2191" /LENGTH=100 /DNA_ID=CAMNT_0005653193 /DNA_START=1243 /DNA_END=1545 /DNA_ORIENTATION=+
MNEGFEISLTSEEDPEPRRIRANSKVLKVLSVICRGGALSPFLLLSMAFESEIEDLLSSVVESVIEERLGLLTLKSVIAERLLVCRSPDSDPLYEARLPV